MNTKVTFCFLEPEFKDLFMAYSWQDVALGFTVLQPGIVLSWFL